MNKIKHYNSYLAGMQDALITTGFDKIPGVVNMDIFEFFTYPNEEQGELDSKSYLEGKVDALLKIIQYILLSWNKLITKE